MKNIPLLKVHMPESAHSALGPVLASGYLADGTQVRQFEDWLRNWVGNPNLTAMSDISGAITLALFMAGVRPGDEVIAAPMSCTATTMPVANLFAKIVWCDVDPLTGMLDASKLATLITAKTKAVLIYHWGGDVADLDSINGVAHAHGLKTIEDAADAFGAELHGHRLGTHGCDFTAYSFQAVKHITAGEGAALFFARPEDAEQAFWLKRYGIHRPSFKSPNGDLNPDSDIPVPGYNFYMNNIAATIALEQTNYADGLIARYRANAAYYDDALQNIQGFKFVNRQPDSIASYWTYTVLVERRADLIRKLKEHGVASQRLHVRNDVYSCFANRRDDLSGVAEFHARTLSLPCGWWVTDEDRSYIVDCIRAGW